MKNTNMLVIGLLILLLGLAGVWFFTSKQNTSDSTETTEVETPPTTETANPTDTLPPATAESPAFVGTIWTASTILGAPTLATTTLTTQFDDQGRVTGSDGCNTFSSGYTTNGTELTIDSAMISTKIACEDEVMQQADAFTTQLLATTSYQLGDGMLVLNQGDVAGLSFFGQSNTLSKTSWTITGYNNGNQAVVSPMLDTTLTMTFGDDGTISGIASCNTFSGQYSLSGQNITIGQLAVTARECIEPEGVMEQETAFLAALESAVTWNVTGSQLDMRTADDALAVTGINNMNL